MMDQIGQPNRPHKLAKHARSRHLPESLFTMRHLGDFVPADHPLPSVSGDRPKITLGKLRSSTVTQCQQDRRNSVHVGTLTLVRAGQGGTRTATPIDNTVLSGHAAVLATPNLDTDQIMPKQFLRGIDKSGLASGLLYDLRFDNAGQPRPDFVLN